MLQIENKFLEDVISGLLLKCFASLQLAEYPDCFSLLIFQPLQYRANLIKHYRAECKTSPNIANLIFEQQTYP